MNKIFGLVILAASFQASGADRETITVSMFDQPLSEIVVAVNKVCSNSKLELDSFSHPDKKVSINFKNEDCAKVLELLSDFEG
ncbi:hypothetical protein [Psychromonas sp. Urea-02u-13]|uniref:hypothetical protein n=1 Tax=Psychromonas sp. Urea-02u-13 TaxID=2058326 RepID=UPI000C349715|nr:hypothetical protein [Psychromonas sp. Urea-02u-13]PKG37483.1 hypothetical protein CXF74_18595 [Psychromonas sp. Urea-02u-13]